MNSSQLGESGAHPQSPNIGTLVARALAYARQHGTRRATTDFGPVRLEIEVCGSVLSGVALDPLRHATVDAAAPADLHLVMIDSRETCIGGPTLESLAALNGSGQPPANDGRRSRLTIHEALRTCCFIDADAREIIVWFDDATAVPEWVVYDQIRNALHWLSYERAFGLFHAAALKLGGVGCLITGKSGSGKSTLTAVAVAAGFDTAGDDFVLVETTPVPRVHAVFDTVKLDEGSLARVPQFRPSIRASQRADDKGIVHLSDTGSRDRIATNFPLHAILHACLTGRQSSRIVRAAPVQVFRALAPSTLKLLRSQGRQVSANCAKLVERLATYTFEIGTDVDVAVAELAGFMNGLEQ